MGKPRYWDYKSPADKKYKQGYLVVSGWCRCLTFFGKDGNISMTAHQYYDAELNLWGDEVVTIHYPISTFVDYLKAIRVKAIRAKKLDNPVFKLPKIEEVILMDNARKYFNK